MQIRLALTSALLCGCLISTDFGDTSFLCVEEPICPAGYACVDGRCVEGDGEQPPEEAGEQALAFQRRLTFDNTGRAALDDVPILVLLDASRIDYAMMRPDAGDLAFVDADGAPLPHEIEEWNPAGQSVVWVKVPSIDAGSTVDFVWMRYGNPEVVIPEDEEEVWSSYRAVYHLGDDAAAGTIDDSSAQRFDGAEIAANAGDSQEGSMVSEGRIGHGRTLNGAGQYLDLGLGRDFLRAAPGFTVEAWLMPTSLSGGVVFASASAVADQDRKPPRIELRAEPQLGVTLTSTTSNGEEGRVYGVAEGEVAWRWVAGVASFSGGAMAVFIDGVPVGNVTGLGFDPLSPDAPSERTTVGVVETLGYGFYAGQLDEVRFAAEPREPDWLSAQYASMTDTLITYGPAEPR